MRRVVSSCTALTVLASRGHRVCFEVIYSSHYVYQGDRGIGGRGGGLSLYAWLTLQPGP